MIKLKKTSLKIYFSLFFVCLLSCKKGNEKKEANIIIPKYLKQEIKSPVNNTNESAILNFIDFGFYIEDWKTGFRFYNHGYSEYKRITKGLVLEDKSKNILIGVMIVEIDKLSDKEKGLQNPFFEVIKKESIEGRIHLTMQAYSNNNKIIISFGNLDPNYVNWVMTNFIADEPPVSLDKKVLNIKLDEFPLYFPDTEQYLYIDCIFQKSENEGSKTTDFFLFFKSGSSRLGYAQEVKLDILGDIQSSISSKSYVDLKVRDSISFFNQNCLTKWVLIRGNNHVKVVENSITGKKVLIKIPYTSSLNWKMKAKNEFDFPFSLRRE